MPDKKDGDSKQERTLSRRLFLKGVGTSAAGTAVAAASLPMLEQTAEAARNAKCFGPEAVPIRLNVNGRTYSVKAEPRETLLDVLRERLDITGPKLVCDKGTCGACTVHLDGTPVYACMMLAISAQGKKIKTIEGMANGDELHPVQQAFVEKDAIQCGFCTPGFVMSMAAVFEQNPRATMDEVKQGVSGHICRCGGYQQIFEAAELMRKGNGG